MSAKRKNRGIFQVIDGATRHFWTWRSDGTVVTLEGAVVAINIHTVEGWKTFKQAQQQEIFGK